MSNPKYTCCVTDCFETRAHHNYINHFLSHSKTDIQKCASLVNNLKLGARGILLKVGISVDAGAEETNSLERFELCLGCKKLFRRTALAVKHKQECLNKEKHKEICASLIPPQPPPTPVTEEAIKKLERELNTSKALSEQLKSNLKVAEASFDKAEDTFQGFLECLTHLYGCRNKKAYEECLAFMKETREEIYNDLIEGLQDNGTIKTSYLQEDEDK